MAAQMATSAMEKVSEKVSFAKKVLKILCYVGSNGHSEFRSALRHKADVVRETESFTGQLDHLQGDALNQRVRAAASELIGLLFNVESSGKSTMHAMMGPTGKKMEGFGNSPSQQPKSKTWLDSMKTLAERLPEAANRLASKNEKESMASTGGSSIRFVNYVDFSDPNSDSKKFVDDEISNRSSEDQESLESEDSLSVEVHLVENITSEGGIRAVPSKQDLNHFTKRCSSLNFDEVLIALNNRLLEPITEVQLKSLHVLEHLLKSDISCVASRMSRFCTNLEEITKSESGSVLSKATKILYLMNAKTEKERIQKDVRFSVEERDVPEGGESLDSTLHSKADQTLTLFSGMSLHSQTDTTKLSALFDSNTTGPEKRSSEGNLDVFQGLDFSSGSDTSRNSNNANQRSKGAKSDFEDFFSVKEDITRSASVKKANGREAAKDSVTDLFDPLLIDSKNSPGNHVTQSNLTSIVEVRKHHNFNSQRNVLEDPQLVSYGNSVIPPQDNILSPMNSLNVNTAASASVNFTSGSQICRNSDDLSHNRTSPPNVTLPTSGAQRTNRRSLQFPYSHHPVFQQPVTSSASSIPLRLPKQSSQRTDFSFVGKSGRADAFSFVKDEMKARK
ncbi:VHS domain-containing protein [Stylophora pistillata]|uniref:VHS domain-containing protein n=1 Tax=Stylophora pistillata TaxID=50429 RepID=A0A2B4R7P5_STYPI|nr:VHS domain-containing protein [Stylophora pistillata]